MRPARVVIPAVVIAALSAYLSHHVFDQWSQAIEPAQRVATLTQAAYGVLGVLAAAAALWRPRALGTLLALWVGAITATAVLAPVVWGGASWFVGLVSGLAAGAIAALLALWCLAASAASLWEDETRRRLAERVRWLNPQARALGQDDLPPDAHARERSAAHVDGRAARRREAITGALSAAQAAGRVCVAMAERPSDRAGAAGAD